MSLTLTDDEKNEVRMLTGLGTMPEQLTDAQIDSASILGAGCDYVYDEILESIDITKISAYSTFDQARAATFNVFLTAALTPLQRRQARRAVVYRSAGIAVGLVTPVSGESANSIDTLRFEVPRWKDRQDDLFRAADDEIRRLRMAFPDDAFLPSEQSGSGIARLAHAALY